MEPSQLPRPHRESSFWRVADVKLGQRQHAQRGAPSHSGHTTPDAVSRDSNPAATVSDCIGCEQEKPRTPSYWLPVVWSPGSQSLCHLPVQTMVPTVWSLGFWPDQNFLGTGEETKVTEAHLLVNGIYCLKSLSQDSRILSRQTDKNALKSCFECHLQVTTANLSDPAGTEVLSWRRVPKLQPLPKLA